MPDNFMGLQDFGIKYEPPKSVYEEIPRQHLNLLQKMGSQDQRGKIEEVAKMVAGGTPIEDVDPKRQADYASKQAMLLASHTEQLDDAGFEQLRQQLQAQVQQRPQVPMVQEAEAPTSGQQIVAALGSLFFPQYAGKIGTLPYQAQEAQAKIANENAGRQYQSDFDAYKQNVDLAAGNLQDFARRDQFRVNEKNESNRAQANLLQGEANRIYADINRVQDGKRQDRQNAFGYLLKADTPGEVEIAAKFLEDSGTPLPPDVIERAKQGATDKQQKLGMGLMRDLMKQIENYGGIQNEAQQKQYAAYAQDIADKYGIPVPPMLIGRNIKGQTLDERIEDRKQKYVHLTTKEQNTLDIANKNVDIAKERVNVARGMLGVAQQNANTTKANSEVYAQLNDARAKAKKPTIEVADKLRSKMVGLGAQMKATKDKKEKAKLQAEMDGVAAELSDVAAEAVNKGILTADEATAYQLAIGRAMGYNVPAPTSPFGGGNTEIKYDPSTMPASPGYGAQNQMPVAPPRPAPAKPAPAKPKPQAKPAPKATNFLDGIFNQAQTAKQPAKQNTSPAKRNDLPPGIRTTKGGAKWTRVKGGN